MLYDENIQQCIDNVIHYVRNIKKVRISTF